MCRSRAIQISTYLLSQTTSGVRGSEPFICENERTRRRRREGGREEERAKTPAQHPLRRLMNKTKIACVGSHFMHMYSRKNKHAYS